MRPRRSVHRARRQQSRNLVGLIVTWDVDSGNPLQCTRARRFIFGHTVSVNGKTYHYPGYVELDGVRYLGQSVQFVIRDRLDALRVFLRANGVEHVVSEATMGRILVNCPQQDLLGNTFTQLGKTRSFTQLSKTRRDPSAAQR